MELTLTPHQEEVGQEVIDNLTNHNMALLSGVAGVGKSTLVERIINTYKKKYKTVWLTGTTHKSVEVVSKMTKHDIRRTSTIHSFLNLIPDRSGFNKPMIVNHKGQNKTTNLLVIEEYSMLTKEVIDALEDKINSSSRMHVLFVGDASQLILNQKEMEVLDLDSVTSFLTKPMRQGAMSDIAMYSSMVSQFILGKGPEPSVPYGEEIIKYTDHNKFIEAWKQSKTKDKAILAFRNQTVKTYNRNIAKYFRHQANEYEVGNLVTLRDSVETTNNTDVIPNRRTIEIESIVEHDNYYVIGSSEGEFKINKTAAWLNALTQKYADASDWVSYYGTRRKYVQVHHADAMTVFAAQGSSFNEVFIDATDMMSAKENVRRMAYVAISRAKQVAHVYMGVDERNYTQFKMNAEDAIAGV